MSIFTPRVNLKPFEYPEVPRFKEAIQQSYWLVSEWNFTADVQQFQTELTPQEREVVRKTLLAISQIEVAVKKFWVQIDRHFPKPEISQVGISFGENEVRHADAYSHLLEVLGLNGDFVELINEPVIADRMSYLTKYMQPIVSDQEYAFVLTLFTLFIENVSLFSQFLIMKSFNTYKNVLKDVDNVIQATFREEDIHGLFGTWLINKMQDEFPEWFDEIFYLRLEEVSQKAFLAESKMVDWIYSQGGLSFLSAAAVKEFIKARINKGLSGIGVADLFELDPVLIKETEWFTNELYGDISTDFFYKRPVTYSKRVQSYGAEDLF